VAYGWPFSHFGDTVTNADNLARYPAILRDDLSQKKPAVIGEWAGFETCGDLVMLRIGPSDCNHKLG
jgi:hypothetical protein